MFLKQAANVFYEYRSSLFFVGIFIYAAKIRSDKRPIFSACFVFYFILSGLMFLGGLFGVIIYELLRLMLKLDRFYEIYISSVVCLIGAIPGWIYGSRVISKPLQKI